MPVQYKSTTSHTGRVTPLSCEVIYERALRYHPLASAIEDFGPVARTHYGYALWEEQAKADSGRTWTKNFVNLSRLGADQHKPLYVDRIHFSADFADEIAARLAAELRTRLLMATVSEEIVHDLPAVAGSRK